MWVMAETSSPCVPMIQDENPCNSSKILKILSFPWPQDVMVDGNATVDIQHPLRQLRGFSVDIITDFLVACPRNITLQLSFLNFLENIPVLDHLRNFNFDILMNQWELSPDLLQGGFLFSFHSYISNVALIYDPMSYANTGSIGSSVFEGFLGSDAGFALIAFSLLGLIVFSILIMMEKVRSSSGGSNGSENMAPGALAWNLTFTTLGSTDPSAFHGIAWRLFAISWSFLWLIITMMFSSHISSTMTVDKIRNPIRTLDELSRSNHEFFWAAFMKRTKYPTFEKLRQRYETFKTPLMEKAEKEDKTATTQLLREGKIYITYWFSFMAEVEGGMEKICGYTVLHDKSLLPMSLHFIFSHREKRLMDEFNHHLHKIRFNGDLKKWQDRWYDNICNNGEPGNHASVELRHIWHVVMVAAVGILVSLVLAIIKFFLGKN